MSVQVPEPVLVRPPVVLPTMEASVPLPAPASVRPKVAPVIVPAFESASVPALEAMVAAEPRVTSPL